MKKILLLLFFLGLRLGSVFYIQTSYVPEEFWNNLEIAHKLAFGYGHISWEYAIGVRSYIYPSIIAGIYKILKFLQRDTGDALILIPRMFQAFLSAVADFIFSMLFNNLQSRQNKSSFSLWAIYTITTSWFWSYCASRTMAGTLETVLTVFGLYCYPWDFLKMRTSKHKLPYLASGMKITVEVEQNRFKMADKISAVLYKKYEQLKGFQWYIPFAVLACLVQPTAVINWSFLFCFHLWCVSNKFKLIMCQYFPVGLILGMSSFLFDSYFYDRYVFVPWNFLKYNLYHNVGDAAQPIYWYITTGFPVIMGFNLLPFLMGLVRLFRHSGTELTCLRVLATNVLWTILIYSLIPHKDFRFILSLLPMSVVISATVLSQWSRSAYRISLCIVAALMLISCVVPVCYFGMVHNQGNIAVMKSLSKVAHKHPTNTSILFLMPCHSTPLYSHLHIDVPAKFLSCKPDFFGKEDYINEVELFYKNPGNWLKNQFKSDKNLPTHIVCFDSLYPTLKDFLNSKGFRLGKKYPHAPYPSFPALKDFLNSSGLHLYEKLPHAPYLSLTALKEFLNSNGLHLYEKLPLDLYVSFPATKKFLDSKGFYLYEKFIQVLYPKNSRVGENIHLYVRK